MMREHRSAGARRDHNEFRVRKYLQEVLLDRARFVDEAGIESRLPAAGLRFTKFDFAAGAFENLGHGEADARKNLVDQAGDENRNAMFQTSVRRIGMLISFTVLDSR